MLVPHMATLSLLPATAPFNNSYTMLIICDVRVIICVMSCLRKRWIVFKPRHYCCEWYQTSLQRRSDSLILAVFGRSVWLPIGRLYWHLASASLSGARLSRQARAASGRPGGGRRGCTVCHRTCDSGRMSPVIGVRDECLRVPAGQHPW